MLAENSHDNEDWKTALGLSIQHHSNLTKLLTMFTIDNNSNKTIYYKCIINVTVTTYWGIFLFYRRCFVVPSCLFF